MTHINLHIHTNHSDGIFSVKEVLEKSKSNGLRIISITDHDNITGSLEAINMIEDDSIEIVTGIELTADYNLGICHILGYNITDINKIVQFTKNIRQNREKKGELMVKLANELGYNLNYLEIKKNIPNGIVGRRDIAKELVKKKIFKDEDTAIKELFIKGKKCYVETKKNTIDSCIEIIKNSGGIAIIAHPWTLNISHKELKKFLLLYKFDGIEVFNHDISYENYKKLCDLADELGLIKTCGTDFHGNKKLDNLIVRENVDCSIFLKKVRRK